MKKIFIITALVSGVLLSFQIRSFKNVETLIERSGPTGVLAELRTFQLANEQLRAQLEEEQQALITINSKLTSEAIEDEITRLKVLSGQQEVSGEGVEITFNQVVPEFWINDIIAQLVGSGAEAISINDIRLTPRTGGFRTVNGGLVMGKEFLHSPLRISAIGPNKDLKQIISQKGGIIEKMETSYKGLVILVSTKNKVIIPALNPI